jgi:DNA-binding NarL/FixJ family response regulator
MSEHGPMGPRVVLADPDEGSLASLRLAFRAGDATVVGEASDGPDAVRLVGTLRPDVAIVDLDMEGVTGMDGYETSQAIREASPDTQVIILTSADEQPTRAADQVGAFAYLVRGGSDALMRDLVALGWRRSLEGRPGGS